MDYMKARDGDSILVPFECDLCVFRKLRQHNPVSSNPQDVLLLACIRRMNLDAFWSRASSTSRGNRDKVRQMLSFSDIVGLNGPFRHEGPFPNFDHCGYEVAIGMLLYSTNTGKLHSDHLQYDTIRKCQSTFGNQVRASPQATAETLVLLDEKGRYKRFVRDPCGSMWFHRFLEGCSKRMGQDWKPNKALDLPLLLELLETIDTKFLESTTPEESNRWVVAHSYVVISYVVSLRGPEGFLLDIEGMKHFWNEKRVDKKFGEFIYICLRGQVKGEHEIRCHILPCVVKTNSGINVRDSLFRLMNTKLAQGLIDGPAISDINGTLFSTHVMNDCLHEALEEIYKTKRFLFPKTIKSVDELRSSYQVYRSLRRSSDTRALEMKIDGEDIDIVNRWVEVEGAKGRRPSRAMKHHYADVTLLLKPFLRYTSAH